MLAIVAILAPCTRCHAAQEGPLIIYPKPGSELKSPENVIRWRIIQPFSKCRLLLGTAPNRGNIFQSRLLPGDTKQARISNVPRDGSDVWVTLRTRDKSGRWHSISQRYRAPRWKTLIEAEPLINLSAALMRTIAKDAGLSRFSSLIQYDVGFVRVRYRTSYQGKRITASGLLSYPLSSPPGYPLMVVQNGMIFGDREAPSAFSLSFSQPEKSRFIGYEFLATAGYLVIFPDWIGFGESSEILFPMYHYESSATASIDMMKAAFEWMHSRKIPAGDKLFIAGYSMGGYTANCLLHEIETKRPFGPGKPVTATALGAGGYDLVSVLGTSITGRSTARPAQVAMLLASYNETNSWNRPLTDFFRKPHASAIPKLLDGRFDTEAVGSRLPANLSSLLNPAFVDDVLHGREPRFVKALAANSIHDWSPASPVRLYHSRNDERIPFSDSRKAYRNMIKGGSRQVELIELPGDDHYNSVFGFMELVIPWFESLR